MAAIFLLWDTTLMRQAVNIWTGVDTETYTRSQD